MDESISKNIRDNLILFKNETLKDIKEAKKILIDKFSDLEYRILEKIDNFDKNHSKISQKIEEIISFIDSLKDIKNNVNLLLAYKSKSENSLIDLGIKLKSLDKDYNKSIFSINNILKDSVIYPGIIGGSSKFKTFHDIIDYTLANISYSNSFKDKIIKEVNHNKINSEINIEKLKNQIQAILDKTNNIITNEITTSEEKTENKFKKYDEKLQNLITENNKNNFNIQKELDDLMNKLKEQINETNEIKKDLFLKFNELKDKYNQNNNGINNLNEKNIKLSNFLMEMNYKIDNSFFNESDMNDQTNKKRYNMKKSNRFMSASNNDIKESKYKKFERGFNLIKEKINIEHLQTQQNKNNYKVIETNISNELYSKENKNNRIIDFFRKSQSYKRFPFNKENEKIIIKNNNIGIMNMNNNNESSEYYNSFCNKRKRKKKNENNEAVNNNSFKINFFNNLNEKSTYVNLYSNSKFNNSKNLKNSSLNQQNELISNEDNITNNYIDNKNEKNLLQTNNINNFKSPQKHKYISGYPRIITNQGERILISSHPVYHRHKFTSNFNPSIFLTYKNTNHFYNKKKENKNISNNNINTYNERKLTDENNNKYKYINKKSNYNDFYNDNNIFKTLPNPKSCKSCDKKDFNNNIERNNYYINIKKNIKGK